MLQPTRDAWASQVEDTLMPLLIRLLVNAAALWVATRIVTGVTYSGAILPFIGVALIFGIVNTLIRPVLKFVTFPLIILTFGIFALIVNGLMLWLTSRLAGSLGLGFHVNGFGAAFWGALVVSIVSTLLGLFLRDRDERND
jgi:putative membrane protein